MMTEHDMHPMTSDEMLVAFIDGELDAGEQRAMEDLLEKDPALAARLELLAGSPPPLQGAFDALLEEAPVTKMKERLALSTARPKSEPLYTRRGLIAASIALIAFGVAADRGVGAYLSSQRKNDEEGWRGVVANYMALYSAETLEYLPGTGEAESAQIASVGKALGLPLERANIELGNVAFKRAQMLKFKNKPLAQIAYLDPADGPVALCIMPSKAGQSAPQTEQRRGLNLVFWSSPTHQFLVIGRAPTGKLEELAGHLRQTLPA
jgi:anti-sigma factor RsiW